jgi:hypothetical protein
MKKLIIHPFLFVIYPILFLYTNNISMLEIDHIFMPIILAISGVLLVWIFLNFIIRNKYKSSIITSLFFILFFSYGHLIEILAIFPDFPEKTLGISSDMYVSLNLFLIITIASYLVIKFLKNHLQLTALLNFISFGLLVYPIVIIIQSGTLEPSKQDNRLRVNFNDNVLPDTEEVRKPDIYYIVLDGYGRDDVLKSVYGFDNKDFLNELEERYFFIARKSRANYAQTLLSLSSTLNMNYLDSSNNSSDIKNFRINLSSKISDNRVVSTLKEIGYKFVTFSTGYSGTEVKNSDLYIAPRFSFDEFQFMLIGTTPLYKLLEIIPDMSPTYLQRQRIQYTIDKIPDIELDDSPMFLFAHIVAPHPPFVLGQNEILKRQQKTRYTDFRDGSHYHSLNKLLQEEYKAKYITQLIEINKLIIKMVDKILIKKKREAIIILQSDHGPGLLLDWENPTSKTYTERLPIFNAYYFLNKKITTITNSITPVNTFRILFNNFFNTKYEILGDKSYFSTWSRPYRFINVDQYFN